MRIAGYSDEFRPDIDLALPDDPPHRRERGDSTLHAILCLLLAQMVGVALYAGMLHFS